MALIVADRVQETTNSSGTGSYTLGGAVAGFQTFDTALSNGDTLYYAITNNADFEVGLGTYNASGGTIARTTVFTSSNSNNAVNWNVGTKNIFLTYPASKAVIEDASNNVTIGNNLVVGGTVDGVDIASRNAVLTSTTTTANAALPKAGGAMTGAITTNSTFDGRDVATDGTKLDSIEASADVTDTANVTAAGALMDSEVDVDIKTLSLPANTTISAYGKTIVDDANASAARTTLGVAIGSNVQAYSSVLQNTTASFLTADETKLDYITVTQAVSLDQMETDIAALENGMVYKGDWNAGSGSFPGGGSAQTGWFYYVSGAGTVNSISFAVGDNIVATTDNASASTYANNWSKHDQTDAVQAVVGLTGSIAKGSLLSALNVEDGADVTDTANVTSAGALMRSGGAITGAITTASNANIDLLPNGSGKVNLDGNGSSGGVAISDGLVDIRTGTGARSQVKFYCEVSNAHAQTIQPQPHSANVTNTLTLPAGSSQELVGTTATQTLTNKSIVATQLTGTIADARFPSALPAISGANLTNLPSLPLSGGAMTGAITTNSTFDGRDVATDGTKLDGIEASADVTDTANVTAAGALMDSEVDADIKTLVLPASTTISTYGRTLVDDADAATARTTLGLGTAATTASTAYATAAQGTKADAALPKAGGAMTGAITTNSTFDGRDVATDGSKLDGIEASADVTDTANVTSAGALMDSELTNLAAVKAINQSLVTTASPTFAGLNASGDFTLDVAGDITLDADGGDVYFKDAGTANFQIKLSPSSAGVEFYNTVADEDLRIILNDGGNNVTALTLDASDGGTAIFGSWQKMADNNRLVFGAGSDMSLYSDGTNGNILVDGNLTLDASGDIILDADGADILLKDGGTSFASLTNSSSNFHIVSEVSDKDILFRGNDGGSFITALTLDMSDGGFATFNKGIQLGGNLVRAADFELDVSGDISLDADGGQIFLKDGGTQWLELGNGGSGPIIKSSVQDKDILFQGNDGGSGITALTLDMSQAGRATFNEGIVAGTSSAGGFGLTLNTLAGDNMALSVTDTGSAGAAHGTISVSDGDLTLDVAGKIVLDADGGEFTFSDGGTAIGRLRNVSSDFRIQSLVSDKDIVFVGNDGGSDVTALTLDMSAAGAATFNNDVTAFSDERLKSNITTIPDALSKVTEMRGVHYVRDATGKDSTGVIAQEMQKVAPELVLTADDEMGTLSVNYGNITGYLIEAIKELKAEIEELKAR